MSLPRAAATGDSGDGDSDDGDGLLAEVLAPAPAPAAAESLELNRCRRPSSTHEESPRRRGVGCRGEPNTVKTWRQKVRRTSRAVAIGKSSKATLQMAHQQSVEALRHAVDGVLVTKTTTTKQQHLTYKTAIRVALAPTHMGLQTLQAALFADGLSASSIRRARLRIAGSLRRLHCMKLATSMTAWAGRRPDPAKPLLQLAVSAVTTVQ